MRRHTRTLALSLIVVFSSLSACGGSNVIKSFRLAIAASGPLVNSLVASGAIPQNKAADIIRDFDDGAKCGLALSDAFKAASALPKEQQRSAKLAASQIAFQCFRVIVQRQNFAQHKRLQDAANIAEGILASLVIFYSDSAVADIQPAFTAKDEDELMDKMESEVKRLEKAMQP